MEVANIKRSELRQTSIIAEGTYGVVYRGEWCGNPVALKMLKVTMSRQCRKELLDEARWASSVSDVGMFVNVLGVCKDPNRPIIIVMELLDRNLHDLLSDTSIELTWAMKVEILVNAAKALQYLHNHNILHADLKSYNYLIRNDAPLHPLLSDFGLARVRAESTRSLSKSPNDDPLLPVGTPRWVAPEVVKGEKVKKWSDVFSFGVVMWEVVSRQIPWMKYDHPFASMFNVCKGERMEIPEECPRKIAQLIEECWKDKPEERPDMNRVVEMLEEVNLELSGSS